MQDNTAPKKKTKFTTIIVIFVLLQVLVFTGIMIGLFCRFGHIPDGLIIPFFSFMGTELGLCSFVTNSTNKYDYLNNNIPPQGGVG